MDRVVVAARTLGFCAGPQDHTFYACAEHRPTLEKGDVSCFLQLKNQPMRDVTEDEAETYDCYFCREG